MEMRIFTGVLRTNPSGSDGKESPLQCRRHGSIPGSGRSPGEVDGNPLQYSCLENPMDKGTWQPTRLQGHKELDMTEQLTLSTLRTIAR